jgi:ComF family protein
MKYTPKPDLGKFLAQLLADKLKVIEILDRVDGVTYVPIHYKKESLRGFNQAAIVAKEFARLMGLPYFSDQVIQTKAVSDQIGLTAEERFRNVHDIYEVSSEFGLAGKNVLLIDDVTTSGATLNSVAATLRKAGATSVVAVTVAVALEEGIDPSSMYEQLAEDEF